MKVVHSDYFNGLKFGRYTCFKFDIYSYPEEEIILIWRREEDKKNPIKLSIRDKKVMISWAYLDKDFYFDKDSGDKIVGFIETLVQRKSILQ